MPILVGIDGTGGGWFYNTRGRNTDYDRAFANSFVRRLCLGRNNATYIRGPITPGGGLPEGIGQGEAFIEAQRRQRPNEPILLTGFSRGGLGVLVIARNLQRRNIPVQAMLLFDAVDMHLGYSVDTVPTNVRNVYHVRRDPAAGSRDTWGNCGLNPNNPAVNYREKFFRCTHGAVGGTPQTDPNNPNGLVDEFGSGGTNVTFRDNPIISQQVWMDVQPFIRTHGFI